MIAITVRVSGDCYYLYQISLKQLLQINQCMSLCVRGVSGGRASKGSGGSGGSRPGTAMQSSSDPGQDPPDPPGPGVRGVRGQQQKYKTMFIVHFFMRALQ